MNGRSPYNAKEAIAERRPIKESEPRIHKVVPKLAYELGIDSPNGSRP